MSLLFFGRPLVEGVSGRGYQRQIAELCSVDPEKHDGEEWWIVRVLEMRSKYGRRPRALFLTRGGGRVLVDGSSSVDALRKLEAELRTFTSQIAGLLPPPLVVEVECFSVTDPVKSGSRTHFRDLCERNILSELYSGSAVPIEELRQAHSRSEARSDCATCAGAGETLQRNEAALSEATIDVLRPCPGCRPNGRRFS